MIRRYSAYKDSGVEWIGGIPEHWGVIKLKYISEIVYGISPPDTTYNVDEEGAVLVNGPAEYSKADFGYTRSIKWTTAPIKFARKGSLLFCLRGSTGRLNLTHADLSIGRGVCAINSIENQWYLIYSLLIVRFWLQNQLSGSIFSSVTKDDVDNLYICYIPIPEQTKIVEFLDAKTSLIDRLVAVKERRIELLKEKRTALINHAVTKGLNPNVKMKASGIEWIGEIPEHWEYKKITHCFDLIGSGTTPTAGTDEYYEGGEINWLQTGDLTESTITETSRLITQKALDTYKLRLYPKNSLVIAMYGATIGKVGLLAIETTTNQACCVLAKPNKVSPHYVFYWMIAQKEKIVSLGYGGGQPNISQETVRSLRIHYPPILEQQKIVEYLDEETKKIDALVNLEQKKIDLLKEYRQALISEAVTGKIKVTED